MFYDTVESIKNDAYLKGLFETCRKYGINGAYIRHHNSKNPENNGIYFICGYSHNEITAEDLDLEALLIEQNKSKWFKPNMFVQKLNNCSPFAVHMDVVRYCLRATFFRVLVNKYGFNKKINEIPYDFLSKSYELYSKIYDLSIPERERSQAEKELGKYVPSVCEFVYSRNGKDILYPERILAPEEMDPFFPNMRSLEDVIFNSNEARKITMRTCNANSFKHRLKAHPKVTYFQSDSIEDMSPRAVMNLRDASGLTTFVYDAEYEQEVQSSYLKVMYPDAFKYSIKDVESFNSGSRSFGIKEDDIPVFFDRCEESGIVACINQNELFFNVNNPGKTELNENYKTYKVFFSEEQKNAVQLILNDIVRGSTVGRWFDLEDKGYNVVPMAYRTQPNNKVE